MNISNQLFLVSCEMWTLGKKKESDFQISVKSFWYNWMTWHGNSLSRHCAFVFLWFDSNCVSQTHAALCLLSARSHAGSAGYRVTIWLTACMSALVGWQSGNGRKSCSSLWHSQEFLYLFQLDWWCFNLWRVSSELWTLGRTANTVFPSFLFSHVHNQQMNVLASSLYETWSPDVLNTQCRDWDFTVELLQERERDDNGMAAAHFPSFLLPSSSLVSLLHLKTELTGAVCICL